MGFRTRLLYSYIIARSIAFLIRFRDIIYGALLVILMAVRPDGILTESMVDKISRKLGFKKAPYIPESQVLQNVLKRINANSKKKNKDRRELNAIRIK